MLGKIDVAFFIFMIVHVVFACDDNPEFLTKETSEEVSFKEWCFRKTERQYFRLCPLIKWREDEGQGG